eukprot:RCo041821
MTLFLCPFSDSSEYVEVLKENVRCGYCICKCKTFFPTYPNPFSLFPFSFFLFPFSFFLFPFVVVCGCLWLCEVVILYPFPLHTPHHLTANLALEMTTAS